jgi:hypothetical protein
VTTAAAGVTGLTSVGTAAELIRKEFYALEFVIATQPAAAAQRDQPVQRGPHDLSYGVDIRVARGRRQRRTQLAERRRQRDRGVLGGEVQRAGAAEHALSVVAAVGSLALAALSGRWVAAGASATAIGLQLLWLVLYVRVSAPINRRPTAAATAGDVPPDARRLQNNWDRIIAPRAVLQGLIVVALCVASLS